MQKRFKTEKILMLRTEKPESHCTPVDSVSKNQAVKQTAEPEGGLENPIKHLTTSQLLLELYTYI